MAAGAGGTIISHLPHCASNSEPCRCLSGTWQGTWQGSPHSQGRHVVDVPGLAAGAEAELGPHPQGLPRMLWELGHGAPATSRAALGLLLDAGRTAAPGGPLATALTALQVLRPVLHVCCACCSCVPSPCRTASRGCIATPVDIEQIRVTTMGSRCDG